MGVCLMKHDMEFNEHTHAHTVIQIHTTTTINSILTIELLSNFQPWNRLNRFPLMTFIFLSHNNVGVVYVCMCAHDAIAKCHTFINRLMEHGNRSNRIISVIHIHIIHMRISIYLCVIYRIQWHIRMASLDIQKSQTKREMRFIYTNRLDIHIIGMLNFLKWIVRFVITTIFYFPIWFRFDSTDFLNTKHQSVQYRNR